jgi:hypothetical protein
LGWKKSATPLSSALATLYSEVSARDDCPRSTRERKPIEKPLNRERSRRERLADACGNG